MSDDRTKAAIADDDNALARGGNTCPCQSCPCCRGVPKRFAKYGVRERVFLVLVDGTVCRTTGRLARWKCPLCKKTFTVYPDFALPFKRYTRPDVIALCEKYLAHEWTTYRDTVCDNGMPLFYPEKEPDPSWWKQADEDEVDPDTCAPALSHTALYRWLTTLANPGFPDMQHEPSSGAVRAPCRVSPNKFRSEERRQALERCAELLQIPPP